MDFPRPRSSGTVARALRPSARCVARTCAAIGLVGPGRGRGLSRQASVGRPHRADRSARRQRSKRCRARLGRNRRVGPGRAQPELRKLVIINSPHPGDVPARPADEPAAAGLSAYMNFLCRPDAEALLAENDYARLWPMFTNMGAADPARLGGGWLTEASVIISRSVGRRPDRRLQLLPRLAAAPADRPRLRGAADRFAPETVTSRVPTLVSGRGRRRAAAAAARRPGGLRAAAGLVRVRARRTGSSTSGRRTSPPRSSASRRADQLRGVRSRIIRSTARCTSGLRFERLQQAGGVRRSSARR